MLELNCGKQERGSSGADKHCQTVLQRFYEKVKHASGRRPSMCGAFYLIHRFPKVRHILPVCLFCLFQFKTQNLTAEKSHQDLLVGRCVCVYF